MSFDAETLYGLLPAVYRIRDAEQGESAAARFLAVIAEQVAVLEEDLEQLYDDQFIETCADWVVPYIGDLIGYRHASHGHVPSRARPRAEVAHTIALRRRKGTAAMLEQLARDVTGWPARAVEFFQLLATTQYMNHLRAGHHTRPTCAAWEPLARIGTAFDALSRTRRRAAHRQRPRPLQHPERRHLPLARWRARRSDAVARRRGSTTGASSSARSASTRRSSRAPRPRTHRRTWPSPSTCRCRSRAARSHRGIADRGDYYGPGRSVCRLCDWQRHAAAEPVRSCACDLSDAGGHLGAPAAPEHDRDRSGARPHRACRARRQADREVEVDYHYGFSADLGGGEYERAASLRRPLLTRRVVRVPDDQATIQAALDALGGHGVVEITDSGRYEETLTINVPGRRRASRCASANGRRPSLVLTGPRRPSAGGSDSEFVLNGLLVSGDASSCRPPPATDSRA